MGIVLTRTPLSGEEAHNALELGQQALLAGQETTIFLLGDGVWLAKRGKVAVLETPLGRFTALGGKVVASGEHMRAAGLGTDQVAGGVVVVDDGIGRLVDLAMDEWDRVIVF